MNSIHTRPPRRDRAPWGSAPLPGLRRRGLAALYVAAALVIGLLATQASADSDPQVTAVQLVIERSNAEQIEALTTNNPAAMSDTATGGYYNQLVQTNQGLLDDGATNIELLDLTWGPVTVDGGSATAATTETWITSYSDSTTEESTNGNVYTLVNQDGNWLIQDDQQPSAAGTPSQGSGGRGGPQAAPVPTVEPGNDNTSRNWSGYSASDGTYTAVSGTWTVPEVTALGAKGVGATWVGIGGVDSRDLIQAGTQDTGSGDGDSQYQAWIEMLPRDSQQVALAVSPGDSVTVTISEASSGSRAWHIAITNNTTAAMYRTDVQYRSSESSVEWIEEAPSGQNGVLPLDDFGTVSFTGATATRNGENLTLGQVGASPITVLNASKQPLAVPSAIGSDGESFTVARTSSPATTTTGHGLPGPSSRAERLIQWQRCWRGVQLCCSENVLIHHGDFSARLNVYRAAEVAVPLGHGTRSTILWR